MTDTEGRSRYYRRDISQRRSRRCVPALRSQTCSSVPSVLESKFFF